MKTFIATLALVALISGSALGATLEFDVEVKDLPAYNVAYVRVVGGYGQPEMIGLAFEKVIGWAEIQGLFAPDTLIIGIGLDDPAMIPMEDCRYDACVTVPEGTEGDEEVGVYEIPAGKYAVLNISGTYDNIAHMIGVGWGLLHMFWYPESGYVIEDRPWLEIYRETEEEMLAGIFRVDLCMPITKPGPSID